MLDVFGPNDSLYGAEISDMESHLQVLEMLGVQTFPRASRIVEILTDLRATGDTSSETMSQAAALCNALAQHCVAVTGDISAESRIDDMTVSEIRKKFGTARNHPGLILAGGQWLPPVALFRGAPIFRNRRSFVPERGRADRLWEVLNVRSPTIRDCIEVHEEITAVERNSSDDAMLIDIYRHLASLLSNANTAERKQIARIALWDGNRWTRHRPIFAIDDPALTDELSSRLATWQCPASLASIDGLPVAMRVTVLERGSFIPTGIDPRAQAEGRSITPTFAAAVRHLKDRLVRTDPDLYDAISIAWTALENAQIALVPNLTLDVQINGHPNVEIPARAHVLWDPLPVLVCIANPDEAGYEETTGRAISAMFARNAPDGRSLDRDKISLIWASAWTRALKGDQAADLNLARNSESADTVLNGLAVGLADGKERRAAISRLPKQPAKINVYAADMPADLSIPATQNENQQSIILRQLKDPSEFIVGGVEIVPESITRGKSKLSRMVTLRAISTGSTGVSNAPQSRKAPVAYTREEIETLAYQVLETVLRTAGREAEDFRHIRRIGADVVDDLGRYYEIKGSFGEMPDTIDLTAHEVKRAQMAKKGEFFLAVISGLEEGYPYRLRIIPDPLDNLEWGENGTLTLTGVRTAKSIVIYEESS
jgi:hypothetical protein